jgi:hypothetical protein
MVRAKVKVAAAVLLAAGLLGGAGIVGYQVQAERQTVAEPDVMPYAAAAVGKSPRPEEPPIEAEEIRPQEEEPPTDDPPAPTPEVHWAVLTSDDEGKVLRKRWPFSRRCCRR